MLYGNGRLYFFQAAAFQELPVHPAALIRIIVPDSASDFSAQSCPNGNANEKRGGSYGNELKS